MRPEAYLKEQFQLALKRAYDLDHDVVIEKPRQAAFGDFATTSALNLAKTLKTAPRQIAEKIVAAFDDPRNLVAKFSIDGPGFINVTLSPDYWRSLLPEIISSGERYGAIDLGRKQKIQIEFVSANPTGPLNVVSARAAAVGDVLVSVLNLAGYDAWREYYVNDAGRQIRLLGASVAARYATLCGREEAVPEDGYQGEYIIDLAREIREEHGDVFMDLEPAERAEKLSQIALDKMLALHRRAMDAYRVQYDLWFRESSLRDAKKHVEVLDILRDKGLTYEKEGAVWFRSTEFGDSKDRVLITRDGEPTYFLVDIAYHKDKYERGFEKIYDLWGPDHHGYIARVSAALQALGYPKDNFQVRIIQQVNMLRDGEVVKMSKRAGNIIEMSEVVDEVGVDAARYFFVMRKLDSPLDFDIELAKKQSDENPVYYVQYAHARLYNIIAHGREKGIELDPHADLSALGQPEEFAVIRKLGDYPEIIRRCAELMEPHHLTTYLIELAGTFHSFYQKHRVISEDAALSRARLVLVEATRTVIKNALGLLKISAPERM